MMAANEISFACPLCKTKLLEFSCPECKIYFPNGVIRSFICKEMYSSESIYRDAMRVIDFWGNGWKKRLQDDEHKFLYTLELEELKKFADLQLSRCKASGSLMSKTQGLKGAIAINIGCGAGVEAVMLARSGATCIAMDITSPAAEAADSLLKKFDRGVGIQGDARFIPLENESVDVVYSSGVLHHSPDIAKSIAEIHRILKPGGVAYVMLYATWSITFLQEKLLRWTGEQAWETDGRKNPYTTTYSLTEGKKLFSAFKDVNIVKKGASLKNIALLGRFLPTIFDKYIDEPLGANLNIVAKKATSI